MTPDTRDEPNASDREAARAKAQPPTSQPGLSRLNTSLASSKANASP
jgi:hypothetical protein